MRVKLALATFLVVLVSGALVASVAADVLAGRGQVTIEGVGLSFAVTGGTGEFKRARGQMHETSLPTGEFRLEDAVDHGGDGLEAAVGVPGVPWAR
jgi:hypothetical protein